MEISLDTWDVFAMIGTVSFALQGGLIAMEKKYDLFAVYLFGLLTAFGGGALQHVLIGGSDYQLWNQRELFIIALISITAAIIFPKRIVQRRLFWTDILDAFGVIAFAIQGSITAVNLDLPASAVVVSAIITATGGGIVRDLLSQRQPVLLGENIYGLWIFLIGMIIGYIREGSFAYQYILFGVFTILRLLSLLYDWKLPYRNFEIKNPN